ncbi:ribonucleoside-diphosphate reductase subunit alpha [Tessaracoccus sp. OS52]|uniref:ribonucleoside-diphosphate reductase subunit alpha n=1 Tax=Tessaracoccus sp. OS52 TaxID=2886691 RepID=UPI001D114680|nr:ribonucleoside-diphosphate reductase subunit alpha [Tessaracoccus sp. OS52]MCC2592325.1 ribonucleoside-diphosphate reductase subunit alpha [Tessaracoccus sp. OS52]
MTTTLNHALPTQPPTTAPHAFAVVKREGAVVAFETEKISVAIAKAFIGVDGQAAAQSSRVRHLVETLTAQVLAALTRRYGSGRSVHVEEIQDQVELALMRSGEHKVARAYVLYREEHARIREGATATPEVPSRLAGLRVRTPDGLQPLDGLRLMRVIAEACDGLARVDPELVLQQTAEALYDELPSEELSIAPVLAARGLVERHPDYSVVSARLLLDGLRSEVLTLLSGETTTATAEEMADLYPNHLKQYVAFGIEVGRLDPRLAEFDLAKLGAAIDPERDLAFTYLGLQTLADRYFLHEDGRRYELPQTFFMRVAMGLALNEDAKEDRAIEFYRLLSGFGFMCSTPTLFNSGTVRPQLSSCFLTTVGDDLSGIFDAIHDNAMLAKFSGGLGNDWTPVRGLGAHIHGTNGRSAGVVPFLKIANDTAVAVNQGGKRKGAVCAYLETWHIDIEEFCELRKNTGDERRRTHDMFTAHWVPDLFLERVESDGVWTLFSPDEVPGLHDAYGSRFRELYEGYEADAEAGRLKVHRSVRAVDLWRRMLTMLFETGHPWITFKDPCNIRSAQQHVGVVHSSNLCTEITLNTSADEIAVCNLGSVNLAAHVTRSGIDVERLRGTIATAVRMLDNVIDLNLYTVDKAERANQRHRPVGLGLMGFADALVKLGIGYASEAAVEFADESMELISHAAITASAQLAEERGAYGSFEGSLWSRGILPIDSVRMLAQERQGDLGQGTSTRLDWAGLRQRVRAGMRNSLLLAIAPTATISNIVGVAQSIEPFYRNLYVKTNMSGDFTVLNGQLVEVLAERGLWDEVMAQDLKYFDGVLGPIDRVPDDVKQLFATAFEIDPSWLIRAASRRQKWLDQAQSLNLYVAEPDGRKLDEMYRLAWRSGCKTTYYLRSQARTHVEKSTLAGTDGRLNAVEVPSATLLGAIPSLVQPDGAPQPCAVIDPECEACQ